MANGEVLTWGGAKGLGTHPPHGYPLTLGVHGSKPTFSTYWGVCVCNI